jgi:uncharacterized protein with HEPN domain
LNRSDEDRVADILEAADEIATLLAHHYQRVDQSQVWVMATTAVPALALRLREGEAANDRRSPCFH